MDVARFDLLHPVVSGNKFFKLKYPMEKAVSLGTKGVITMGGAYSNHLIATAYYTAAHRLSSKAIIRGAISDPVSHTLQHCRRLGMELIPVDRASFDEDLPEVRELLSKYEDHYFVASGGKNEDGIKGAGEMADRIPGFEQYDIIACSIGSGTMYMGLQTALHSHQTLLGIPALKIRPEEREGFYRNHIVSVCNTKMYFEYAGRGFGKADEKILSFMNTLYRKHGIPSDFVYTGKLIYAVMDLIEKGMIDCNQKILIIHSGGLQGNDSLPEKTLIF
jgi:1-aminocyclopropane-1-carboxylate deaminase/D-cysteine desulfhydrase-like pyridoxal-dependent ACC family enzyme